MLENSITHGFEKRGGEGHILVCMKETGELWNITVQDDGDGMTKEELGKLCRQVFENEEPEEKHRHIGLRNVYRRIQVYYGEHYEMRITSEKGYGNDDLCAVSYQYTDFYGNGGAERRGKRRIKAAPKRG